MDKLKMATPDLTDLNIEKIKALFPNVMTETRDENGAVKKAVDFDLLRQALSKNLVEDDNERYRLDWPGKKASLLKANTPITKTLHPCREETIIPANSNKISCLFSKATLKKIVQRKTCSPRLFSTLAWNSPCLSKPRRFSATPYS